MIEKLLCIFTAAILYFNNRLPFINYLVILGNGISVFFPIYMSSNLIYCISYYLFF